MAEERRVEATKLLKKELKEIRGRIKELEDLLYEYEKLEREVEDDLEILQIDEASIPEEYVFTGEGRQVFKNLFLKKGLYEIEIEFEGDSYAEFKAKTRTSTPLSLFMKKGKCLEHIKKSRIYHIEIKIPTEFKVTLRLLE